MKVRAGFVSNSSSSSFIISKDEYPTIWDLAVHMLSIRDIDNVESFGDDYEAPSPALKRAQARRLAGEQEKAITFPSCNFSTFIFDAGDSYWVSTCNNHPFYAKLRGQLPPPDEPCPMSDYSWLDYIELQLEDDHDWKPV